MIDQDKIAVILANQCYEQTHGEWEPSVAQSLEMVNSILQELPKLIPKLVWSGFKSGSYEICVHEGGSADLFCHSERDEDGEPEMLICGFLTLVSLDDFKAKADKHNVDTIMAGLGIALT
jgi:hypothetical protein